ncbi:hypothetical protein E5345_05120 [Propionibacterium sp. NM47_B9-13]|uniref:Uncharacterized protein n=1 Tax=Cutibacterium modestum HL044PA1 TaxID=765109 RepID=A0ABN0C3P5_9ACTN|nr:hypothetical protein HMPREF9607_02181 [Cutibacterium modestum HL044PA1]EFT16004.1 hypothetical protein HMPREF9622_00864 [Cutibacterium modestum HL037PA3]REB75540.1 hypothetical protein CP877_03270 [Cutibacterium modestum]TGY29642.1 hypothetical protein E5345_05120 [Propionibacterium sp. NM47_B9-13]
MDPARPRPWSKTRLRAFAPALSILRLTDDSLELWISDAWPTNVTDTVADTVEGFDGSIDQTHRSKSPCLGPRLTWCGQYRATRHLGLRSTPRGEGHRHCGWPSRRVRPC